jgi:hypothetical protein
LTQSPSGSRSQKHTTSDSKRCSASRREAASAGDADSDVAAVDRLVGPHRRAASLAQLPQRFRSAATNDCNATSLTSLEPTKAIDSSMRGVDLLLQLFDHRRCRRACNIDLRRLAFESFKVTLEPAKFSPHYEPFHTQSISARIPKFPRRVSERVEPFISIPHRSLSFAAARTCNVMPKRIE